jgi:hypothetical protein
MRARWESGSRTPGGWLPDVGRTRRPCPARRTARSRASCVRNGRAIVNCGCSSRWAARTTFTSSSFTAACRAGRRGRAPRVPLRLAFEPCHRRPGAIGRQVEARHRPAAAKHWDRGSRTRFCRRELAAQRVLEDLPERLAAFAGAPPGGVEQVIIDGNRGAPDAEESASHASAGADATSFVGRRVGSRVGRQGAGAFLRTVAIGGGCNPALPGMS